MGLLDVITGGKSGEASDALKQAMADIANVKTPTVQDLQFQIQKLTEAGKITPAEAKTFLQNPSAFLNENIDQTGTQAQQKAIAELLNAVSEGGLNPEEQAKLSDIEQQLGATEKGANDAIVQRQAERGALTGGETLAAQLEGNQTADVTANKNAEAAAAEAYNAMLQELTSAGSLGAGLQGQENTQGNTVAAATDAINRFNAAQEQNQENFNVGNKNTAQAENVKNEQRIGDTNVTNTNEHALQQSQLPQEVYQDEIQKAAAEAGVSENMATQDTAQGGQNAALIGGLVGTGGEVAASALAPTPVLAAAPMVSGGGEIHSYLKGGLVKPDAPRERAVIPGNSPKNDKIPAVLSEGEVVLPRTVAHNPQPDKVMEFLKRLRTPKPQIHPEDTAHVLKALSLARDRHGMEAV